MGKFAFHARPPLDRVWTMYKKTVLKNGVRIISKQLDHLRSVSLGIWVDAGSRDEDRSENGTAHFIEHMIFKGTPKRNSHQIAKELDAIGGLSNAFTGKENTCFYARVLGKDFNLLADILADIFLDSEFDPDDVERERQVILQEINMVQDSPNDNIHELFSHFLWMNHPIGMSVLGTDRTVSAIKREHILKYIKRFYVPEKILVAAAGNADHRSVVSFFSPLFERLDRGNHIPERTAPHTNAGISTNFKDLEQVHICMGGEAVPLAGEKRFACAIFNTILGGNMSSRLFQEIREKRGLAYSVYSFVSAYLDTGLLGVYVATDQQNVNPALESIQTEVTKIIKGQVPESDLRAAKDHLIGGIYLASESAENQMMRIAKNEFVFGRYVGCEELVSDIKKVTVDQVVEMADDIFRDDKISLTTLGPLKEEDLDGGKLLFG